MKLEVVADIKTAEKLWNLYVPKKNIFDLWEFRWSFNQAFKYKLHFCVIKQKDKVISFIPLWYSTVKKCYECIGGGWCENNDFFKKKSKDLEKVLKLLPTPLNARSIQQNSVKKESWKFFDKDDEVYEKNLKGFTDMNSLLMTIKKKYRYNLQRDYKRILDENSRILWIKDKNEQLRYLSKLAELSIRRFSLSWTEKSTFEDPREIECFKYIVKNAESYKTRMLIVEVDAKLVAVEFITEYKGVWNVITGANDFVKTPGIGNFVTYLEFEKALSEKIKVLNVMQEDCGWKHRYFDARPMLFVKS